MIIIVLYVYIELCHSVCLTFHHPIKNSLPFKSGWVIKGNEFLSCSSQCSYLEPWDAKLEVCLLWGYHVVRKSVHMERPCVGDLGSESLFLSYSSSGSVCVTEWTFRWLQLPHHSVTSRCGVKVPDIWSSNNPLCLFWNPDT